MGFTLFVCRPWESFELELRAACAEGYRDRERARDLERLRELYPETETQESDVVPAELVLEWDAYG